MIDPGRYCVVCGHRLSDSYTGEELKAMGAATEIKGILHYHCIDRHSAKRIAEGAKFAPSIPREWSELNAKF